MNKLLQLAQWLKNYNGRPLRLMEVCGTHTAALHSTGIRDILPKNIQLVSGPGCPVCVTPSAYIDKLVDYAFQEGCEVLTFGDMLRVPGSQMSLAEAKAQGGRVEFFYNPEDVLTRAKNHPDIRYILGAVGFETTAPVWATLLQEVAQEKLTNVGFLTALKTMPVAIGNLCEEGEIDGFLCPGHVAVITGCEPFRRLSEQYHKPMVIGGFDQEHLLRALCRLVAQAAKKEEGFVNEYTGVVAEKGNPLAQQITAEFFEPGAAAWRGFGLLNDSGLYLKEEYQNYDAGSRGLNEDKLPGGCCCDKVLLGKMAPHQCPCFGRACTPEHPVGACMVSGEGSCAITYRNGGSHEN